MTPTTQQKIIRGLLWVAYALLLIPLAVAAIVAAAGMLCLSGIENLRDRIAEKLALDRD